MDDRAWQAARAAWPDVELPRAELEAFLANRDPPANDDGLAELYLACACARGNRAALAAFDARYLDVVAVALAPMGLPAATVDDVRQQVREKLLVADGDRPPRIGDYAGQGKLRGLVQVVAVRTALSRIRKGKRERPADADALMAIPSPEHDPELQVLKATYRAEFATAFEAAVAALASRDRNILRLHLIDGLTVEQVGDVYSVHRATVTRWLAKVRSQLLSDTRKRMRTALRIDGDELDSVMKLIQSRLDVSVQRMLTSR